MDEPEHGGARQLAGHFLIPLVFLPLVLLGLSPAHVSLSLALGLLFQFFLHTESVGKLGWLEGKLFNTPSAHRVHHGSNREYIDKNYAGVFIVWDRLFGTYQPEHAPVRYGVTSGFMGHNPFKAQFYPLLRLLRGSQGDHGAQFAAMNAGERLLAARARHAIDPDANLPMRERPGSEGGRRDLDRPHVA